MRVSIFLIPLVLAAQTPPAGKISPVRQEILNSFMAAAGHSYELAKAIPQDKLSWRPMEGVRSFGEVLVHMAGSTMLFCSHAGAKIPDGPAHDLASIYMKRGFEMPEIFASERAIGDKAQIVAVMEQSFKMARDLITNMPDADLEKKVDFFGTPMTGRGVLILMGEHLGEHLGQAIAYARVNHIVPPWSVPQTQKK